MVHLHSLLAVIDLLMSQQRGSSFNPALLPSFSTSFLGCSGILRNKAEKTAVWVGPLHTRSQTEERVGLHSSPACTSEDHTIVGVGRDL